LDPAVIDEFWKMMARADQLQEKVRRFQDVWKERDGVAHLPPERFAALLASTREGKRLWGEYLRLVPGNRVKPTFANLYCGFISFTGALREELSDEDFTALAAEYWRLSRPEEAAPPVGPVQRPDWLTQAMIDSLMAHYGANGETITENEAIVAWMLFLGYTRELADVEKGGQDEDEDRAAED